MIRCADCFHEHSTLLLHCPNCGRQIVNIGTEPDLLIFRASGDWKLSCMVRFDGQIQQKISGFELLPHGLVVINGSGQRKLISRLDLLNRLKQRIEVLEL